MSGFWNDLRHAVRGWQRQPGFALLAVLALGLAIGLTTSILTGFHAVLWRPWPVHDPAHVVEILSLSKEGGLETREFSESEYRAAATRSRAFAGIVAMGCGAEGNPTRGGCRARLNGEDVRTQYVSGSYFPTLGARMALGRGLRAEDDQRNAAAVVVLSDRAWQQRFGRDPNVVGRRVLVNEVPFTIVGVASPDFVGTSLVQMQMWVPLSAMALFRPDVAEMKRLHLAGRIKDGVPLEAARAEIESLVRQVDDERRVRLVATSFLVDPASRGDAHTRLTLMLAGAALVLLIACANVGNILLARAVARRQEIAIRVAVGASRRRIVQQLLTESLVLSGAATAVGLAIAQALPASVLTYLMRSSRLSADTSFDARPGLAVMAAAAVLAVLTSAAFGLAPALYATRTRLRVGRDDDGPGSTVSLRGALLAVQVAICAVLLVSAGLLMRSITQAQKREVGFATSGLVAISFDVPASYTRDRLKTFVRDLMTGARSLSADDPVAFAATAPFDFNERTEACRLPAAATEGGGLPADWMPVSPAFVDVLRVSIVSGRNLTATATADAGEVLVNETLARRLWPGESAVGRRIVCADEEREVVGIVRDTISKLQELAGGGANPTVFPLLTGRGPRPPIALVQDGANVPAVAALAARLDPQVRVRVLPLSLYRDRRLTMARIGAGLAAALGALALALATIGIFGVFSYVVGQRTREIGIRMALGATPAETIRGVLGTSSRAILAGLGGGFAAAIGMSRVLAGHLYGVSPFDPVSFLFAAAVLAIAAVAATYVPARRATRIDPVSALRE